MNAWDVFWFIFIFLPLTILWVIVLLDMMRRPDLVGWQKAIWAMVIIFFPWIGVFAYLIVRPREPAAQTYKGTPSTAPGDYAAPRATESMSPQVAPATGEAQGATT
jgi:hypothetical protein